MTISELLPLANQIKVMQMHLPGSPNRFGIIVTQQEWDSMVDEFTSIFKPSLDIDLYFDKDAAKALGHGVIYGVTVMVDPKEKK